MNDSFLLKIWNQSHSLRGLLLVIIAICFIWALIYSKHKIVSMFIPLLRGLLLVIIVICLLILITGGVSPNPLAILGIAIVCLSLIPKTPEKGRDDV